MPETILTSRPPVEEVESHQPTLQKAEYYLPAPEQLAPYEPTPEGTAPREPTDEEIAAYEPASGNWQIMKETDPDTIHLQVLAGVRHSGGSPALFLNNLADYMAWGRRREDGIKHLYAHVPRVADNYLAKYHAEKKRHEDPRGGDDPQAKHSARMANSTNGQFYADIDAAVAAVARDPKSGIIPESLVALNEARTSGKFMRNPQDYVSLLSPAAQAAYKDPERLNGNLLDAHAMDLLPVYEKLRAMQTDDGRPTGYSHYDLFQ